MAFFSGVPAWCLNAECMALPPFLDVRETYDAPERIVVGTCRCRVCGASILYSRRLTPAEAEVPQVHLQPIRATKEPTMSESDQKTNPLRLFNVGHVGLMLDTYAPGVEKRKEESVKTLVLSLRVLPLTAKLAAALPPGVRNLLFTIDDPKPKEMVGRLTLDLGVPRQNLHVFAAPDVDEARVMIPQAKIKGVYAKVEKGQIGYAFGFQAVFGPVGREELEFIHAWRGAQQFVTFEESEPLLFEVEKQNAKAKTPRGRGRRK